VLIYNIKGISAMTDKKRVNSKAKGSAYELKISKVLGNWWGEEFHRTPASGGLRWKEDNRVVGDIVTPPTSVWPWVTELKKRENWEFTHLLKGTGEIESYWEQVCSDAQRSGLKPMLIFSKNFCPDFLMLPIEDFTQLCVTASNRISKKLMFNYFIVAKTDKPPRVVCILDDFVKAITKQDVIKTYNL